MTDGVFEILNGFPFNLFFDFDIMQLLLLLLTLMSQLLKCLAIGSVSSQLGNFQLLLSKNSLTARHVRSKALNLRVMLRLSL